MRKIHIFLIAGAIAATGLSVPPANAALITVACSEGGSFTVNDVTNTVTAGGTCAGTAIIPSGVTIIGSYAFRDAPIKSVQLPQGLTTIGQQSFQRSGLLTINIPNSVTYIGVLALSMPSLFNSVNFEPGGSSGLTIDAFSFQYFKGTCVVLPSRLTTLNYSTFDAHTQLQNIYISGDAPTVNSNFNFTGPTVYYKTTATGFTNPWYGLTTQASTFTAPAFTLSSTHETTTTSTAITGYSVNQTGGSVGCYSIFPAPAAGLAFNSTTGVLSGTPTSTGVPTTYTITGANGAGSTSATFTLSVPPAPAFTLSQSNETTTAGTPLTGYSVNSTGGSISSYSISPSARNGLSFSTSSGLLSGTPNASDTGTVYTITGTNIAGSSTATYRVKVDAAPIAPPAPAPIPDPPQTSTIERAFPTTGPTAGGTQVSVVVTSSGCNVSNVSINQRNLPLSSWSVSQNQLIITMPPSDTGRVEITIWNGCVPLLPTISYLYANAESPVVSQPNLLETTTIQASQSTGSETNLVKETSTVTTPDIEKSSERAPLEKPLSLKVYFALSSFKVDSKSLYIIQTFASQISGLGKKITVSITGYAQPTPGSEATDGILSENRAAAVAKALRKYGVTTKVIYKGAGRAELNLPASRYVEIVAANR